VNDKAMFSGFIYGCGAVNGIGAGDIREGMDGLGANRMSGASFESLRSFCDSVYEIALGFLFF
jgi:hypothetical protein